MQNAYIEYSYTVKHETAEDSMAGLQTNSKISTKRVNQDIEVGWTDGQIDRWADKQIDGWMDKR